MTHTITTIAVLGAGTMGHGIAHVAAMAGYTTVLYDIEDEFVQRGLARIADNLNKGVEKGKITEQDRHATLSLITTSTDLMEATAGAQLVIEAIPERMDLKEQVFKAVSKNAPEAILATNTSSLSVTAIASHALAPGNVIGMHFFNPPHIVKLLEIVRAQQTSNDVLAAVREVGARMQREMIVVNDSPGFATSRLGLVIALEAMRMLEAGVGSVEDIDRAMELGYRHPMGPLRLTDLVGLDTRLAIAEYLHAEVGEQFRPPQVLKKLVRAGKLGKKTGEGFYKYQA